jgi:hypothetical protein
MLSPSNAARDRSNAKSRKEVALQQNLIKNYNSMEPMDDTVSND